jgi:hypothetical protein
MDRPFVHFSSDDGPFLINLEQICWVENVKEDQITLHTSDGHAHIINDKKAVPQLIMLLCRYTVETDGRPFGLDGEEEHSETKGVSES